MPQPPNQKRKAEASSGDRKKQRPGGICFLRHQCEHFLVSLGVDSSYLDRQHDHCYCGTCYPAAYPDVIDEDGRHKYVIPRGW